MTPRIERLASGGWLVRANGRHMFAYAMLDEACAEMVAGFSEDDGRNMSSEKKERAARLLRYLHRYDDWCDEAPTPDAAFSRFEMTPREASKWNGGTRRHLFWAVLRDFPRHAKPIDVHLDFVDGAPANIRFQNEGREVHPDDVALWRFAERWPDVPKVSGPTKGVE